MKKVIRSVQSTVAQQSKAQFTRSQVRQHRNTHENKLTPERVLGSFQLLKQANRQLRKMSVGVLSIVDAVYRGHHRRHWMKDDRCEHVFRISLSDLSGVRADHACPYCNPCSDLERFGSIAAIQEHVRELTYGNIHFNAENNIGFDDDQYGFYCAIHDLSFSLTFEDFIHKSVDQKGNGCPFCKLNDEGW